MTLRHGRALLAMPGPTTLPDEVVQAMARPAIDIYDGELVAITARCLKRLNDVFRTTHRSYIYAANGHGAWEAALTNVLSRGDTLLVLESGRFAVNWGRMGEVMGVKIQTLNAPQRRAVDPDAVYRALADDRDGVIRGVLLVQVDTSSGIVNDVQAVREAMNRAGHDALLMVDTVASLATMPFEMDEWGVDVAVGGSQKGLMSPPGLSFVAANARAKALHQSAGLRTPYWDWTEREGPEHYQNYCGTPPEHMLFALDKALDLLLSEGLDAAFRRHRLLARAVRAAVSTWADGAPFDFNVLSPSERADSVTPVRMDVGHDPAPIVEFCRDVCGVTLGIGIGDLKGKAFRIAHMGHVNAPMVLGTLGSIELALSHLGLDHGRGAVDAAVDALAAGLAS